MGGIQMGGVEFLGEWSGSGILPGFSKSMESGRIAASTMQRARPRRGRAPCYSKYT